MIKFLNKVLEMCCHYIRSTVSYIENILKFAVRTQRPFNNSNLPVEGTSWNHSVASYRCVHNASGVELMEERPLERLEIHKISPTQEDLTNVHSEFLNFILPCTSSH